MKENKISICQRANIVSKCQDMHSKRFFKIRLRQEWRVKHQEKQEKVVNKGGQTVERASKASKIS